MHAHCTSLLLLFLSGFLTGSSDTRAIAQDYIEKCQIKTLKLQPQANKNSTKIYEVLSTGLVTWRQAWRLCASRHMSLLTIESKEEEDKVKPLLKSGFTWTSALRVGNRWHWLITLSNGEFVTKPFAYKAWAHGEPDDRVGEENCMATYKADSNPELHNPTLFEGWNDFICSGQAFCICESSV